MIPVSLHSYSYSLGLSRSFVWLGSKSIQRNDGVKRSWLLAQPVFSAR